MNSLNGSTQRSSSPLSGTGMQRSSSQNELLKSTLSRVILDGSPVVIERKPSVVSLSGSPLTRKNNEDSASIPSLLQGLGPLEALMDQDPSNIVQLLPDIASHLQQECISNPSLCPIIWDSLKSLLEQVNEAGKEHRQGAARSLTLNPPFCEAKPTTIINCHGEEWTDNYGWLNDRNNQDVLDYIEAENKYADAKLESSKPLQKLLYKEFVSRLNDNAESARVTLADGWTYYSKFAPGQEYRIQCRISPDGQTEEVYLDENILAEKAQDEEEASYFRIGFLKHSPDCSLVAFGVDLWGNERYTAKFLHLDTKTFLEDRIDGVYEDFAFGNDNKHVYYTLLDDCERAYQVKRHRLGADVATDEVLHHEEDEMFFVTLSKSCNGKFIFVKLAAQITSETRYISADDPNDTPHLLLPRRDNIQYSCEHHEGYFYVLTNDGAKNNYIFRTPVPPPNSAEHSAEFVQENQEIVIEHRDFVLIEDFHIRQHHLIVVERSNCLQNIRIVDLREDGFSTYHYVGFSEVVYAIWPGSVREEEANLINAVQYDTEIFRFTYTSFIQPKQVIDYNMDTREMTTVHEETVAGPIPYDPSLYSSKRLYATGVDGTVIPVSIVFRRDLLGMNMTPAQHNPVLLHAYGAYGSFTNLIFSASRLSLLDRGFIYAAAHVRGGADMGNGWYEEGKLGKKPNTFHDFCAVAEYLVKEGYTVPDKMSIYGRSAGGLLIGSVINMRPDLFKAALTEVPFVDVINTMFDTSIPWTAFGIIYLSLLFEEWGDPRNLDIYEVMKTYCPYTNIDGELLAQNKYPDLLVVGGMNDPRVAFFEPLKFVAKMRGERRKWAKVLKEKGLEPEGEVRMTLLRIQDVGHGGNSGQYSYLEDLAYEYSFLITSLGASTQPFYHGIASNFYEAYSVATPLAFSMSRKLASSESESPDQQDQQHSSLKKKRSIRLSNQNLRLRGKEDEEKEYRTKAKKGDRGQNKLFQWLNSFGF